MDGLILLGMQKAGLVLSAFLFKQVVYSTLLFLPALLVSLALKNRSVYWQMGIWLLVFARLVLPPEAALPFSARSLIETLSPRVSQTISKSVAKGLVHSDAVFGPVLPRLDARWSPAAPPGPPPPPHRSESGKGAVFYILPAVLTCWCAGFALYLFLFCRRLRFFINVLKASPAVSEPAVTDTVARWKTSFGIKRAIRVVASDRFRQPFTLGIFKPVIFLPAELLAGEADTVQVVIAHEMAHIRNYDALWITLQRLILAVYFFHPVAWFASRRINVARESICDAGVLAKGAIAPRAYGRGMIDVLKTALYRPDPFKPLPGFGNTKKSIEYRINRILKGGAMKPSNLLAVVLILGAAGIFILPMAIHSSGTIETRSSILLSQNTFNRSIKGSPTDLSGITRYVVEPLPQAIQAKAAQNPNVGTPRKQTHRFHDLFQAGRLPGIDYVIGEKPVTAVAAGIVQFVGESNSVPDTTTGLYVRIYHDFYMGLKEDFYNEVTFYRSQAYRSTYYRLSNVQVRPGQAVKRGQIIGFGTRTGQTAPRNFKLFFEERGNPVSPDNYGRGHGFMQAAGSPAVGETSLEEMNRRLDVQQALVARFNSHYANKQSDNLYSKLHATIETEKFTGYPVKWSTVERFRYLEYLYSTDAGLFPELSSGEFERLKAAFYKNQPIVLSLPF